MNHQVESLAVGRSGEVERLHSGCDRAEKTSGIGIVHRDLCRVRSIQNIDTAQIGVVRAAKGIGVVERAVASDVHAGEICGLRQRNRLRHL